MREGSKAKQLTREVAVKETDKLLIHCCLIAGSTAVSPLKEKVRKKEKQIPKEKGRERRNCMRK